MIIDPLGEVLAEAGGEEQTISAAIDRHAVFEVRKRSFIHRDRRPELYGDICAPTEDVVVRFDG